MISLGLSTATIAAQTDGIGTYTKTLLNFFTHDPNIKVYGLKNYRDILHSTIDLYHVTDYKIPRLRCPVVVTLHDAIPLKHPEWVRSTCRVLKNFYLKYSAKNWADYIIALSHAAIPDLVEYYGISEKNISVIHCGVDAHWLTTVDNKQATLNKYGITKPYFLFVGTLQPRKNLKRLLLAFEKFKHDYQLVVVGKYGWDVDDILPLLHRPNVRWLTTISDQEELKAIYQGAHVFVFPSLYEGFGIPVLEAFASKIPVVASNTTSLPEVVHDAGILVNPLSVEEIRAAMEKLSDDQVLRKTCIEKGIVIAKEKTWQKCAEETLKVYRKLL